MLNKRLEDLQLADLEALSRDEIPEGLQLEFKRELDLTGTEQKRELAKDISGMANAAGGRIVYGVEERELGDGSKVAGAIRPLRDGRLAEQLNSIISNTIHPRPRFKIRRVETSPEGFVLIVEVYASYDRDLHMVTAYKENRFYKRTDRSVEPMTEPEIRESYSRIAISTSALEDSVEMAIGKELSIRKASSESVIVAPWYPRRNLANPALLRDLGGDLARGPLNRFDTDAFLSSLRAFGGGLRAVCPMHATPETASSYFVITRSGLIHYSETSLQPDDRGNNIYYLDYSLELIFSFLRAAQLTYDRMNYWGPVRVLHRLRLPPKTYAFHAKWNMLSRAILMPAGEHQSIVGDVNLKEVGDDIDWVAQQILDEIFQTAGKFRCDWFDESGHLRPEFRPRD